MSLGDMSAWVLLHVLRRNVLLSKRDPPLGRDGFGVMYSSGLVQRRLLAIFQVFWYEVMSLYAGILLVRWFSLGSSDLRNGLHRFAWIQGCQSGWIFRML